jgi:predicted nucleic acid-binding protein
MKEAIIVDIGYWTALFDRRDTNHDYLFIRISHAEAQSLSLIVRTKARDRSRKPRLGPRQR